jgi:L-fuconolactonase
MTEEHVAINRAFGPADLEPLVERNGVDAVILVQGACLDSDTDDLFAAAAANEFIGAVTAWVDLLRPELAAARLDELQRRRKLRAIRHLIHNEPDHWIVQPPVLETIALLEQRDLILEAPVVYPRHFDDLVALAERFPRLRLVIDHLGKPPLGDAEMRQWEIQLRRCASFPSMLAKVSGLNTVLACEWTIEAVRPAVEIALDCLGPDRLMCGSDWPVALLNGTYDQVWQANLELATVLAGADAEKLLGDNACRIYGIESPGVAA